MPNTQDLFKRAYDNLRKGRKLESKLKQMEGTTFHIPYFDVDEEQILRQRPDYEEMVWNLYLLPEENNTDLKSGDLVYEVKDVKVIEASGLLYRAQRLLDITDFDAKVRLTLDFGDIAPRSIQQLGKYPLYDRIEGKAWVDRVVPDSGDVDLLHDQVIFVQSWNGPKTFDHSFMTLNRCLSALWNEPQSLEENLEVRDQWKRFNRNRERWQ